MSDFVEWIAAEGDEPVNGALGGPLWPTEERISDSVSPKSDVPWQKLPVHSFPGASAEREQQYEDAVYRNPDLWLYRGRTVALLRRYMRLSLETGRLPSIVGKEFFRATVTCYRSVTFEDRVIFVSDVEKILSGLEDWDQQVIARIILQEHSHDETARILHCSRRTIQRRVPEVLDLLSEDFLEVGLLVALPLRRGRPR
jgi:hypothetical protein